MFTFHSLRRLRRTQKRAFAWLQTPIDLDIVIEIGIAQEQGRAPIGTCALFAADLAPRATVSRRLARLKKLGVVNERRSETDRRRLELTISRSVSAAFSQVFSQLSTK